jgi:hypothetical protein
MISRFEKQYPNITVEESFGEPEAMTIWNILGPQCHPGRNSGTPTMAFCYPDHVAEYLAKDAVVDMTSYLNDRFGGRLPSQRWFAQGQLLARL